jgi:hypothetical protein
MLELFAFALVAMALAAPFLVQLIWGQLEQSSQDTAAAQDERPSGPAQSAAKLQPFAPPSSQPQLSSRPQTLSSPGGPCPMTPSSSAWSRNWS